MGWSKQFIQCKTRKTAIKRAPMGTSKLVKVEGGWLAFEFMTDYEVWARSK